MTIGDRIATIRKDSGLNQEKFAQRLMLSRSYISNIEKGRKEPSASLRKLLCMEFCVNENWLLTGKEPIYNRGAMDLLHLTNAAREKDSSEPNGNEKVEAILIAAQLFSIFPNIAVSCNSVEDFLLLFENRDFCSAFNTLAFSFWQAIKGKEESFGILKAVSDQLGKPLASTTAQEVKRINLDLHSNRTLTKYLHFVMLDKDIEDDIYGE